MKAVKLRGFKSFVDPVEVRLEPGVAVVIGPNGSGKSNVSDAILWATGSLSPHELRAEKPDDVLFSGSARKAVDFCEVELVFDNEDGAWPELPFAEVSLARRLHRGGEGQYLVNRAAVRRLDLVERSPTSAWRRPSVDDLAGQGRVGPRAKPAERRQLVEAAAGLGKFKLRRHRAELKLARVATQVERARPRGRGAKAAAPARAAGDGRRARGELGEGVARLQAADRDARPGRRRRAPGRGRGARRQRSPLAASSDEARLAARRADAPREELTDAAGARDVGKRCALPAAQRRRAGVALRRGGPPDAARPARASDAAPREGTAAKLRRSARPRPPCGARARALARAQGCTSACPGARRGTASGSRSRKWRSGRAGSRR